MDSGGYGPVVINKPISITAPAGIYAGVSVFSGTGIVANPGSGVVTLTGLTITGLGGTYGIEYQSGTLRVNNVVVSGFANTGLYGAVAASGAVEILDSAFVDQAFIGVTLATTSGTLLVTMERTRFENNTFGVNLTDNVSGVIRDSLFAGNTGSGGYIQAINAGSKTKMSLERCAIVGSPYGIILGYTSNVTTIEITDSQIADNSNTGVAVEPGGTVYFSNNRITRNATGIDTAVFGAGGVAISFGDNQVNANGAGETFTSTILKK